MLVSKEECDFAPMVVIHMYYIVNAMAVISLFIQIVMHALEAAAMEDVIMRHVNVRAVTSLFIQVVLHALEAAAMEGAIIMFQNKFQNKLQHPWSPRAYDAKTLGAILIFIRHQLTVSACTVM